MVTLEMLDKWGANTREGLMRCAYNESFYLSLVRKVIWDDRFDAMDKQLRKGDLEAARQTASALAETAGNLSLTLLVEKLETLIRKIDTGSGATELVSAFRDALKCLEYAREMDRKE